VPLVLDVLPLIEATAEPRPFLHLLHLGAVAYVAIVSPGPIDVSTLAALPVFGREQSLAFLRGLLPDVGEVLFCFRFVATAEPRTRSPAGVLLAPDTRRRGCVGGLLFSASVALLPVGKAKVAATLIGAEPVPFPRLVGHSGGPSLEILVAHRLHWHASPLRSIHFAIGVTLRCCQDPRGLILGVKSGLLH